MADSPRYVIVDTNLLVNYLHPNANDSKKLNDRCRVLFDAAAVAQWSGLRLFVPAISVAEAIGVLDKYRYCTWTGPVRNNPALRLTPNRYAALKEQLKVSIRERRLEQIEYEPTHVSLAELISPVNQWYQVRRGGPKGAKFKRPMGAADCMIGGMAILLNRRLGGVKVVLATGDQRLADVMTKCSGLDLKQAQRLGIATAAAEVGIPWSANIFPDVINLRDAPVSELRRVFGGWPLPSAPCIQKGRDDLSGSDKLLLADVWRRVARRHRISNPDRLPHTEIIDQLRTEFAAVSSVDASSASVFHTLVGMRKTNQLPLVK